MGNGPVNGTDPTGLIPPGWDSPRPGIGLPGNGFPSPTPGGKPFGGGGVTPSNAVDYYCHYLIPGNSARADPWYLNWGSEAGFVTAIVAGGGAIGIGAIGGATVGGGVLSSGARQVLLNYGSRPEAMAALAQLQALKDSLPQGSKACIRLTQRLDEFEAAIREAFPFK